MRKPFMDAERAQYRKALAEARIGVDSREVGDPELETFLRLIATRLEMLLEYPPELEDTELTVTALRLFLPVLDLDWLPSALANKPELTEEDQERIESFRHHRRLLAFDSTTLPPGNARTKMVLLDLALEGAAMFTKYPNQDGELGCVSLLADLTRETEGGENHQPQPAPWVC